jgi:hypothetical protein
MALSSGSSWAMRSWGAQEWARTRLARGTICRPWCAGSAPTCLATRLCTTTRRPRPARCVLLLSACAGWAGLDLARHVQQRGHGLRRPLNLHAAPVPYHVCTAKGFAGAASVWIFRRGRWLYAQYYGVRRYDLLSQSHAIWCQSPVRW